SSFVDFRVGLLSSKAWPPEKKKGLAIAFVLSLIALSANPLGFTMLWYPVDLMLNRTLSVGIVEEWQQTNINDPRGLILIAVAGLVLLVPLMRRMDLFAS